MTIQHFRLRAYIVLSVLLHVFVLWLLRSLPPLPSSPPASSPPPVAIRLFEPPTGGAVPPPAVQPPPAPPAAPPSAATQEARRPPVAPLELPKAPVPPPDTPPLPQLSPKSPQEGIVVELPKPVQEQRPDSARIVSQYNSKAQDLGPGESGTRKPSGEQPPVLPREILLPERYSKAVPTPPADLPPTVPQPQPVLPRPPPPALPTPERPKTASPAPASPAPQRSARPQPLPAPRAPSDAPAASRQARLLPETDAPARLQADGRRQSEPPGGLSAAGREAPAGTMGPTTPGKATEPRFQITNEQEVAMLQRDRPSTGSGAGSATLDEHFARLEKHQPLVSFDAPGTYQRGPERPGEGRSDTGGGGGKYQSIDSFGLKHFSYLIGVKRKIELVFAVPFFTPNNGGVGVPIVGFTIRRNGELAETVLIRSSGYAIVDKALMEAIKRAAPYGPFPDHLPDPEISIKVFATLS